MMLHLMMVMVIIWMDMGGRDDEDEVAEGPRECR